MNTLSLFSFLLAISVVICCSMNKIIVRKIAGIIAIKTIQNGFLPNVVTVHEERPFAVNENEDEISKNGMLTSFL